VELNDLSHKVIGAAIEVHKNIGPGLLESVYRECLSYELNSYGLDVKKEVCLLVEYKGLHLKSSYRMDLLVENQLVVELKAIDKFNPVHLAQVLSYLKMGHYDLGLLINFNVTQLKYGVKRIINK